MVKTLGAKALTSISHAPGRPSRQLSITVFNSTQFTPKDEILRLKVPWKGTLLIICTRRRLGLMKRYGDMPGLESKIVIDRIDGRAIPHGDSTNEEVGANLHTSNCVLSIRD